MLSVLSVFTAVKGLPWKLIGWATLAFAIIAMLAALRLEQAQNGKLKAQLHESVAAREADRATYTKAQADAAALNAATVAADKAQRERITHDVSQSYEAQLASLRADLASRLRQQASPAAKGAPSPSDLPSVSPAPSGPDGGSRVSIPSGLYVRGAELELQLEQLQHWIAEQVKVDPNTP